MRKMLLENGVGVLVDVGVRVLAGVFVGVLVVVLVEVGVGVFVDGIRVFVGVLVGESGTKERSSK